MKKGKVHIVDNLLSQSEIQYLENCINTFKPDRTPEEVGNNYYNSYVDISRLSNFSNKAKDYCLSKGSVRTVEVKGAFINKISTTSNQSDDFHDDYSLVSAVTLLSDDYEGGEFNYKDSKKESVSIRCDKFTTLIFNGKETLHRVLPVTKGTRWSLATFFLTKIKTTNTLL